MGFARCALHTRGRAIPDPTNLSAEIVSKTGDEIRLILAMPQSGKIFDKAGQAVYSSDTRGLDPAFSETSFFLNIVLCD